MFSLSPSFCGASKIWVRGGFLGGRNEWNFCFFSIVDSSRGAVVFLVGSVALLENVVVDGIVRWWLLLVKVFNCKENETERSI